MTSIIDASANSRSTPTGQVPALSEQHSVLVQQAFTAIDGAATVEAVKKVLAEWTGLAAYAREAKDNQLEADAAEIRMRAERRLGEMIKAQKETVGLNKGGRPKTGSGADPVSEPKGTLAEAGIDKHLADSARKQAAKSEAQFEKDVAEKKSGIVKGKRKTVNIKPSPDKPLPKLVPPKTGCENIVAAWANATATERTHAVVAIGLTPLLEALPPDWWPLLEQAVIDYYKEIIAERRWGDLRHTIDYHNKLSAERRLKQSAAQITPAAPTAIPDDLSIPPFLDRRSEAPPKEGVAP
jgi:hypothetical protein